ncbi:MAG TPA: M48 family metallopeptidase [Verrucomicrobiae bacterium]|nr:M48 family metallopeptidase [Verrucomicrobiae bacterium]
MDFFERQDNARRNTKWLLLYYPIALVLIIASVYLVVAIVWSRNSLWNPQLAALTVVGTLLLIGGATLLKINELRGGGGAVARMLGGTPVDPNTRDVDERRLLNVVEEMAIASGTAVPEVWLLRDEPGINAFAAGHDINDAAVAVTNGAMKLLSRDELQGVIAHEFSHIFHGDVRLNARVLGLLHGILIIALIGRVCMRTRGGKKNPLPLVGVALFIIGSSGFFFGRIIRSAVSRQREYLADSAAVQFTRNPLGLAGALKKIGGLANGSVMLSGRAEEASHFFFANGVSGLWSGLMSTHPPLEKRIRLLDGSFDGKYPKVAVPAADQVRMLTSFLEQGLAGKVSAASEVAQEMHNVRAETALNRVGAPDSQHLHYASEFRERLPAALNNAAHEPMEAVHLIFALLLAQEPAIRETQLRQLQHYAEPTRRLAALADPLPVTFRLPMVSLAVPTLKRLSPKQYEEFARYMEMLVACDKEIDLFEYTLKTIISRNLAPASPHPMQYYSLRSLLPECAVLISALARVGHADLAATTAAFESGMNTLGSEASGLKLLNLEQCGITHIDHVLARLAQASPGIKKRVLRACAYAVAADNLIQTEEAELLRAIAETLDCPIPPFIQGVA